MHAKNLGLEHTVIFKYITAGKQGAVNPGDNPDIIVVGHAPEEFNINFASRWDQNFLGKMSESVMQRMNEWGSATLGAGLGDPITSVLSYGGSSNPSVSVTLEFNAETNAFEDVVVPVLNLCRMCLPSKIRTGMIEYPGPVAYDELRKLFGEVTQSVSNWISGQDDVSKRASEGGNVDRDGNVNQGSPRIAVRLGGAIYLRSVVIDSVSVRFSSAVDSTRRPIRSLATVAFRRFMSPMREEMEETFMAAPGGTYNDFA